MYCFPLWVAASVAGPPSAAPLDPYPPVHGGSRVGALNPQSPGT